MSRSKPDVFMPLIVDKYLGDTMHLTTEQHGAYLLLLIAYWKNQGPLPDEDQALAAITKTDQKKWKKEIRAVVSKFFQIESGFWVQKRAQIELDRAVDLTETRRKSGKTGGQASAVARSKREANGTAKGEANTEQIPKQKPTPIQSTSSASQSSARSEDSAEVFRLQRVLGIDETDHRQVVRDLDALVSLKAEGCDFAKHLMPAAEHAARSGAKKSVSYIAARAREMRDAERKVAELPVPIEHTHADGWRNRVRAFVEKGLWSAKWGPKPHESGCVVPAEILREFDLLGEAAA